MKFIQQTWSDKFKLTDGPYFVSSIQDYFASIIKKHVTVADNPPTKIKNIRKQNR